MHDNGFLEELVKTNKRYKGFTIYSKPVPFKDTPLFSDKYWCIQVHDTTPVKDNDIIGFAGQCKVKNGEVVSLDGDSYSANMTVVGYCEFYNGDSLCLDLLVDEW